MLYTFFVPKMELSLAVDRFCVKEMQEIVEESGQKLEKIPRY